MRFFQELPKQFRDKNNKNTAKGVYMEQLKKGNKNAKNTSKEDRFREIYKEKVAELRNQALKGATYTFQLPGTDPSKTRELSKGAQEIINKIAEKKAKKAEKTMKKANQVTIAPKYFTGLQGGRIDSRGYIYDSAGQWIMTVDKKTGKIKNRKTGTTVGKYNPDSAYSEHRMCELIYELDTTRQAGWYAGSQGHGSMGGGWGKESDSGDIWGSKAPSSGTVWGNNNDDDNNNGGWW